MKRIITLAITILIMLFSTTFAFADSDPYVVVVNPGQYSTVYSDNLLISIKILEPKTIRVSFYEELEVRNNVAGTVDVNKINEPEDLLAIPELTSVLMQDRDIFECNNYLSFYTKSIEDLAPGLYRVRVDTLNSYSTPIYTTNTYVIIKDKNLEAAGNTIFDDAEPTTFERLQNFFTNIFGN